LNGAEQVFVGVGSNLGDPIAHVRQALGLLAGMPMTRFVAASALYRSAPVDATGPDFVNAVVELRTTLPPHTLLAQLQAIERQLGRERPYRHAPRTLDLDLLLYGQRSLRSPTLTLPHPRMFERAFVLAPLAELAPDLTCADGRNMQQVLAALQDQSVEKLQA
jgi:2-amino-4-hydroxy-6-hydroxymethyldihydropteridine diphosphokinase